MQNQGRYWWVRRDPLSSGLDKKPPEPSRPRKQSDPFFATEEKFFRDFLRGPGLQDTLLKDLIFRDQDQGPQKWKHQHRERDQRNTRYRN